MFTRLSVHCALRIVAHEQLERRREVELAVRVRDTRRAAAPARRRPDRARLAAARAAALALLRTASSAGDAFASGLRPGAVSAPWRRRACRRSRPQPDSRSGVAAAGAPTRANASTSSAERAVEHVRRRSSHPLRAIADADLHVVEAMRASARRGRSRSSRRAPSRAGSSRQSRSSRCGSAFSSIATPTSPAFSITASMSIAYGSRVSSSRPVGWPRIVRCGSSSALQHALGHLRARSCRSASAREPIT